MKINVSEDCGNAPKKAQLRDFTIAYANNDLAHVLDNLTDTIRWETLGNRVLEGKDAVAAALGKTKPIRVVELTIKNVLTHGNIGAVDGVLAMDDGAQLAFCEVYRFSSSAKDAKIKEITSYVVAL